MSGIEVWNLIAPILAKCLPLDKRDEARETYITIYIALKEHDEREGKNDKA